jgi:hypothetical protein
VAALAHLHRATGGRPRTSRARTEGAARGPAARATDAAGSRRCSA